MKVQTVKPMLLLGSFSQRNHSVAHPQWEPSALNWMKLKLQDCTWAAVNRALSKAAAVHVSVSQGYVFAKTRSGPAALILKPKSKPRSLASQLYSWGSFSMLKFCMFDHDLKTRHYWLFTLLSEMFLLLCLIKRYNSDKENLSLTVAATWQDNLLKSELFESHIVWSIRHQVTSLTVCVPPVNWLISLDLVNWLVVVALCGHSSRFVRPRTELKFLVWMKTSWGVGLPTSLRGILVLTDKWNVIRALCNLLRKTSVCASELSPPEWA